MNLKRKMISVNENTYLDLKKLGTAGDSFNDVLIEVLKKIKPVQIEEKVDESPVKSAIEF